MKVDVQVFSYLREYLPPEMNASGKITLELSASATLKDVFAALGIAARLGEKIFASDVNNTFQVLINDAAVNHYSHPLADGDVIIMFPPMAGG